MDIQIDNQQTKQPIKAKAIQQKTRAILNALDCPDGELSIVLVDDVRIADLNRMYLQHTGPTNVISFPMREGDFSQINPQILGDVVISMDTCAREAEEAGMAMETRLDQLLIHGILHLLGYDHVHSESEARVMEARSNELLALLEGLE
jgi:probable rRNA maturation factor